jgi:hypothetical protein
MSKQKPTLQDIDVRNLRFYAEMFREHEWSTVQIHWGVFEQTLCEIATRISAAQETAAELVEANAYAARLLKSIGPAEQFPSFEVCIDIVGKLTQLDHALGSRRVYFERSAAELARAMKERDRLGERNQELLEALEDAVSLLDRAPLSYPYNDESNNVRVKARHVMKQCSQWCTP